MILLIDNYDSFSYNLYQLIGSLTPDIKVIRNDEMTVEQIEKLKHKAQGIASKMSPPKIAPAKNIFSFVNLIHYNVYTYNEIEHSNFTKAYKNLLFQRLSFIIYHIPFFMSTPSSNESFCAPPRS